VSDEKKEPTSWVRDILLLAVAAAFFFLGKHENLIDALWILLGILLAERGASWLVGGASRAAMRMRIPESVVGVTIVALGTSSPELVASVIAASQGNPGIAIGNVIGSNIFNIGAILGLTGSIWPLKAGRETLLWEGPWLIISSLALLVLCLLGTEIASATTSAATAGESVLTLSRMEGVILLGLFVAFMITCLVNALRHRRMKPSPDAVEMDAGESETWDPKDGPKGALGWIADIFFILLGLGTLIVGAKLLVDGSVSIARVLQVPDIVIGLTVVAAGTSVPELATSMVAAKRGLHGIAVPNVTGSNIQNILLILGITAIVAPAGTLIIQPEWLTIDFAVMGGFTLVLLFFMWRGGHVNRIRSIFLFVVFLAYVSWLVAGALKLV